MKARRSLSSIPSLARRPRTSKRSRGCCRSSAVWSIGELVDAALAVEPPAPTETAPGRIGPRQTRRFGARWGARIRTWEWRNQNPLPYDLATGVAGNRSDQAARGRPAAQTGRRPQRPPPRMMFSRLRLIMFLARHGSTAIIGSVGRAGPELAGHLPFPTGDRGRGPVHTARDAEKQDGWPLSLPAPETTPAKPAFRFVVVYNGPVAELGRAPFPGARVARPKAHAGRPCEMSQYCPSNSGGWRTPDIRGVLHAHTHQLASEQRPPGTISCQASGTISS